MLRFLAVRHLAVIDHLEVEFEPGLNVLTGETGAGKTIVVAAIDLLLGGRASADLIRTGETVASVQAIFDLPGGREAIVRRELSAQGRSRAFIDDALATSAALREFGAALVDLHGQHEHQTLLDPDEHVVLLDGFGGLDTLASRAAEAFDAWRAAAAALDRVRLSETDRQARLDLARFQIQEIAAVAPAAGEDEALAAERTVLANADRLGRLSEEAYGALYEGDHAALGALAGVWRRVADLAAIDPRFAAHLEARGDVTARLEELAHALRSYRADLDASPDRLQAVEDRLAAIERLKRRHGPALADVLAKHAALAEDVAELEAGDERTGTLEARHREAEAAFVAVGEELSAARRAAAGTLGRALASALAELAMPKARIEIRVDASLPDAWTRRGMDAVEFRLSPNPGEEVRPLARIASGGELSRIMLALRTLGRGHESPRTLVFDEVDAGIGGEAADAVGARLQELATRHQVLCITHLPQIAARGGAHFQIGKHVRGGRTHTTVTRLDGAGREAEIGRMIAGAEVTPRVLASAREMLERRRGEQNTKVEQDGGPGGRRRGA